MQDAVTGSVTDLDDRFEESCAAAEVRP
jgi:hypothetical protein